MGRNLELKPFVPLLIVLLLVSTGFIGVSNQAEEVVIEREEEVEQHLITSSSPLMDSAWPMHGHNIRHTGRSPYSTVDTWDLLWRFDTTGWALGSPSIDNNGTIYIGAWYFYAVYPNGTLKWKYNPGDTIEQCCPAIDENGVIYVGTSSHGGYLHAVNPDGTLKWKYPADSFIVASPIIDSSGVIYYVGGDLSPQSGHITALYPNGTLKWRYLTNNVMYSSPAIGLDGTIYCGCHDNHVYALYPNNGALKWKYNTGSWVHGSPTIADDGTVYIGSDNGYLYAFYPNNGTVKWKVNIGATYGSLALDKDGTIYVGVWEKKFYAVNPNGTIKWSFNPGARVWGSSPALSDDNTIYFGTCDLELTGGIEIIALYTNGTVKWRKGLDTVFSSPAIAEDGTVYIGSCGGPSGGYLNAFGKGELEADANGPYYGLIDEPKQFTGSAKGGYSPYTWYWDLGDTYTSDEQNPSHTFSIPGNYTVTLTVIDDSGNTSEDITWAWIQETNDPPDKPSISGETNGKIKTEYDYIFLSSDPEELHIWYFIDWRDGTDTGWIGPYPSDKKITVNHKWSEQGDYNIRCRTKDPYGAESDWGELRVTMPKTKQPTNWWFLQFLEKHPRMFPIIRQLLGL